MSYRRLLMRLMPSVPLRDRHKQAGGYSMVIAPHTSILPIYTFMVSDLISYQTLQTVFFPKAFLIILSFCAFIASLSFLLVLAKFPFLVFLVQIVSFKHQGFALQISETSKTGRQKARPLQVMIA